MSKLPPFPRIVGQVQQDGSVSFDRRFLRHLEQWQRTTDTTVVQVDESTASLEAKIALLALAPVAVVQTPDPFPVTSAVAVPAEQSDGLEAVCIPDILTEDLGPV